MTPTSVRKLLLAFSALLSLSSAFAGDIGEENSCGRVIASDFLALKTYASIDAPRIAKLAPGTEVKFAIADYYTEWMQVYVTTGKAVGATGFVSPRYVRSTGQNCINP